MEDLKRKIEEYTVQFDEIALNLEDTQSLQDLRNQYLGRKKGYVTLLLEGLKNFPPEQKREAGQMINDFKNHIQDRLQSLKDKLTATPAPASEEKMDLTLPGRRLYWGSHHPLLRFNQKVICIFLNMGFSVESGPEVETDYYNFEALNFSAHHPSRDEGDTFYINDDLLLRTHTSPVQIRVMEKRKPPIQVINPGKVFRRGHPDSSHLPILFQVEGLVVDHGITFSHLKGTLECFLKALYKDKIKIRWRPSYFPFTEPSAAVDIGCHVCAGEDKNCSVCGGTGWVEIFGAGMVDPQVFKNVNIDPEKFSGFAFGMAVDRTAMLYYQIPDLRLFYENDLRFIRQFQ